VHPVGKVLDTEHAAAAQLSLPAPNQPDRLRTFGFSDDGIAHARRNVRELCLFEHLGGPVHRYLARPVGDQQTVTLGLRHADDAFVNSQVMDIEFGQLAPIWWRLVAAEQSHYFPPSSNHLEAIF